MAQDATNAQLPRRSLRSFEKPRQLVKQRLQQARQVRAALARQGNPLSAADRLCDCRPRSFCRRAAGSACTGLSPRSEWFIFPRSAAGAFVRCGCRNSPSIPPSPRPFPLTLLPIVGHCRQQQHCQRHRAQRHLGKWQRACAMGVIGPHACPHTCLGTGRRDLLDWGQCSSACQRRHLGHRILCALPTAEATSTRSPGSQWLPSGPRASCASGASSDLMAAECSAHGGGARPHGTKRGSQSQQSQPHIICGTGACPNSVRLAWLQATVAARVSGRWGRSSGTSGRG